jgi:hypothetical protein
LILPEVQKDCLIDKGTLECEVVLTPHVLGEDPPERRIQEGHRSGKESLFLASYIGIVDALDCFYIIPYLRK